MTNSRVSAKMNENNRFFRLTQLLYFELIARIRFRPNKNNQLKVIITGLPRSGTSFLTNLVYVMGFEIGPPNWLQSSDENNRLGYFECRPLTRITKRILDNLGGDFHKNIPNLSNNWVNGFSKEQNQISNIISNGRIELVKDNRLMLLSDLYYDLFPNAKWIFIERDILETYRSRFGEHISFEDWEEITFKRLETWCSSDASLHALHLQYQDFRLDAPLTIHSVAEFLNIELSREVYNKCVRLFKPRS